MIGVRTEQLQKLYADHVRLPDAPPTTNGHRPRSDLPLSDEQVLDLCRKASNASRFEALYDRGDLSKYAGDHSRADQALLSIMAFYTQDPEQLDRLFRGSALCREKWTGRPDYRRRTIEKALGGLTETYKGSAKFKSGGARVESLSTNGGEQPERRGIPGRVLIGERLAGSAEPPGQLVEDLIYETRMHSLSSEPGEGKTNVALWAAAKVVKRGLPVLYLDAENGPALVAERLAGMGADPEALDELLHYFPAPQIGTDPDSLAALRATAEDVGPALAIFDSWPDFLALAGLDENSATEVTRWTLAVPQLLKDLGCAALLLDHVTKSAEGRGRYARGSGAKLAKMDVAWSLTQTVPFDRERVGEVTLTLRKDREAHLPVRQKFAVGGAGDGIVFRRAAGVIEETDEAGLTDRQRQALDHLEARGEQGASWSELLAELGGSKGTLSNVLRELARLNLLEKRHGRYHISSRLNPSNSVGKPKTEGSVGFNGGSIEHDDPGAPGRVQPGTPPLEGCTGEPGAPNPAEKTVREMVAGLLAEPPSGVRLQVAEYRRQGSPARLLNPLAAAVASELFGGPHRWREVLTFVEDFAAHGIDGECEEC